MSSKISELTTLSDLTGTLYIPIIKESGVVFNNYKVDLSNFALTTTITDANYISHSDFSSSGLLKRTGSETYTAIPDNSANWDSAYSWGDHSGQGYLTSAVTSVAATVPTGFTISGSPITTTGTLVIAYDTGYQGYTTTEATKLSGIESGATADQTGSEIKSLYEAEANTNAFTDAYKAKVDSITFSFTFDGTSQTMEDPGSGKFRLNHATPASATAIAIAADLADTTDVSDAIKAMIDGGGRLTVGTGTKVHVFDTGTVTDNTDWLQIAVSSVATAGSALADTDACQLFFTPNSGTNAAAAAASAVAAGVSAGAALTAEANATAAAASLIGVTDWSMIDPTDWNTPSAVKQYSMPYATVGQVIYGDIAGTDGWFRDRDGSAVLWGQGSQFDILSGAANLIGIDFTNSIFFRRDASTPANNRFITLAAAITAGLVTDQGGGVYDIATSAIPGFTDTEYTIYAASGAPSTSPATQCLVGLSDGTVNNRATLRGITNGRKLNGFVRSGGTTYTGMSSLADALVADFKAAARFKLNDFNTYLDGSAVPTANPDTSGLMPVSPTRLRIGARADSAVTEVWTGTKQMVLFFPTALDDTQLGTITT